jgi:hypothetical protein
VPETIEKLSSSNFHFTTLSEKPQYNNVDGIMCNH